MCGKPFFNKTMRQSCLAWGDKDIHIIAPDLLGLRYEDRRFVVHQKCVPAVVRYIKNDFAAEPGEQPAAHEVAAVLRELKQLNIRNT